MRNFNYLRFPRLAICPESSSREASNERPERRSRGPRGSSGWERILGRNSSNDDDLASLTESSKISSIEDARRRVYRRSQPTADVLAYLSEEPIRGKLLELPCGDGQTTSKLLELGYDVTPADLFPESFRLHEPKAVKVDMLETLPFPDGSFNYVLCQEGIEHIQAPLRFTQECGRVLRTGGKLMITTPNVLNMSARFSYFLVGQRTLRRGLMDEYFTLQERRGDDLAHGHAWHWRYHLLRYILRLSGFKVHKPLCGKYSWVSVLLSVPFYPVLYWAHRRAIRSMLAKQRGRRSSDLVERAAMAYEEILDHSLSRGVLWGKKLILVAEKEEIGFLDAEEEKGEVLPS